MSATAIVRAPEPPGEIVGESEVLRRAVERADKVALAECRVLLEGESGTGKELFARRIHARSRRADGPFVAINCSAIPPELFESELFGHERGAFTGAGSERRGLFRQAGGGTLFLDDVPELPEPLQAKLLRALQEARVRPVGSDREVRVDARVVAATNRRMPPLVASGAMRGDLYYRLTEAYVRVPPLRERGDDVDLLVRAFVSRYPKVRFSPDALAELRDYKWPGNVRELENAVRGLAAQVGHHGEISGQDVGERLAATSLVEGDSLPRRGDLVMPRNLTLRQVRRRYVLQAYELCGRQVDLTARSLGCSDKTVRRDLALAEGRIAEPDLVRGK